MHTCRLCGEEYDDMRGQRWNLCPVCALRCMATDMDRPGLYNVVYNTRMVYNLGSVSYHRYPPNPYDPWRGQPSTRSTEVFLEAADDLVTACPTGVDHTSADRVTVFVMEDHPMDP